jgi:hypothetical protein
MTPTLLGFLILLSVYSFCFLVQMGVRKIFTDEWIDNGVIGCLLSALLMFVGVIVFVISGIIGQAIVG